jgi:uncharacterized protein YggE
LQKLVVSCENLRQLLDALGSLEPLFENQRCSISVSMRRPLFVAADSAKRQAEQDAVADASVKAQNISERTGLMLAGVGEVEELDVKVGRSGAYGDQDWMGFAAAAGSAAPSDEPLDAATRPSNIRFRVRFCVDASAYKHGSALEFLL